MKPKLTDKDIEEIKKKREKVVKSKATIKK